MGPPLRAELKFPTQQKHQLHCAAMRTNSQTPEGEISAGKTQNDDNCLSHLVCTPSK